MTSFWILHKTAGIWQDFFGISITASFLLHCEEYERIVKLCKRWTGAEAAGDGYDRTAAKISREVPCVQVFRRQ